MSFLLNLIPAPYRLLAEILIIGALVAAAWGWVEYGKHQAHEQGLTEGRNEVQAKWDAERARQFTAALAEAEANAKESKRRLERQKESQDAHDAQAATLQAAAARVDADNGRLSGELAAFTAAACGSAGDPAAVCDRTTALASLGVLTELYRSARTRAAVLGRTADTARSAGLQCERDYDSIAVKP